MASNSAVDPVWLRFEDTRRFVDVPWACAEAVQTYLNRFGIRSTLVLEARERQASLELWPGTDELALRAALAGWAG